jgi:hypothetical protein
MPNRSPLSIDWIFPSGPPRWMGLTDVILGWDEDASGLDLPGSDSRARRTASARRFEKRSFATGRSGGTEQGVGIVGSSTAAAHVEVLEMALAALPEAARPRPEDPPTRAARGC